jgi:TusA-related sulfurtransferase
MTEKAMSLRGLKCPLPALRARKALAGMTSGDVLSIECTHRDRYSQSAATDRRHSRKQG